MDIVEFTKKIHSIEIKYGFFSKRDASGLEYWDIVRHDVFYELYNSICNTGLQKGTRKKNVHLKKLLSLPLLLVDLFKFRLLTAKKYKFMCFVASRNKTAEGENIDIISYDVVDIVSKDSLLIESFNKSVRSNCHRSIFDFGLLESTYKSRLKRFFARKTKIAYDVTEILNEEFGTAVDLDSRISELIQNYSRSYFYYKNLLKRTTPKAIFVVQNGIQKALFKAARSLKIPVIELQHGLIGYVHPAYSYPDIKKLNELDTFPDIFFSFSNFWTNSLRYPVRSTIPMGNSFYSKKAPKKEKEFNITFVLADIYSDDMIRFVNNLLGNGYLGDICLKLHPNQFDEFDTISDLFKNCDNVKVVSNQRSMIDILSVSKAIFAIQSTVVYEALHNNVKVYLYKIRDYLTHLDVIGNPNVYLVESCVDINLFDNKEFVNFEESEMFLPFNDELFKDFLLKFNA